MTGAGCSVSAGICSCGSFSGTESQCPPSLTAVCCQTASECHCSYGGSCSAGEQKVPSCSAAALQPSKQCPSGHSPVASCG
jgi:hypothetical protein